MVTKSYICLIPIVLALLSGCGPADQTPPENSNSDKVAVVITGWGETRGYDEQFRKQVRLTQTGAKRRYPFEACTENYVGRWPFASQVGLLPFAIMHKVPLLGAAYDSMGVYRLAEDGSEYVALWDSSVRLSVDEVPDIEGMVRPVTQSPLFADRSLNGIDPRDGSNYLENVYQIGMPSRERGDNPLAFPNGISDVNEIGLAGSIADAHFMNEDLAVTPNPADEEMTGATIKQLKTLFGDRIEVKFGAYAATPGLHETEGQVAVDFVEQGFRKLVLTRETSDNNHYANKFATYGFVQRELCLAGYDDDVTIKQTRQVGRTPEYNTALLEVLRPHVQAGDEGSEVAVIYTTYGMPFPGNSRSGPFGVGHPLAKDVYHENAYLNYQSFKRYAQDEFGDKYQLAFNHAGESGDSRLHSYYAYAMFPSRFYGAEDDPLRFPTIRENIDKAKADGRDRIVVLLSHWNYSNTDNMLAMRKLNKIPYNSREQMRQQQYWQAWCELPGSSEPVDCASDGAIVLRFSEVFDQQAQAFATGYSHRIRGTIERYGLLPEGVEVVASGNVTALGGGSVTVVDGPLAGTALVVPADPRPGQPESFEPEAYEAFVDPASPFIGAWFDFEPYIAWVADIAAPEAAINIPVLLGPYRTIVNKPARVTLAYNQNQLAQNEIPQALIYNEFTQDWDKVYPVAGGSAPSVDAQSGRYSFDTQVLGVFVLVAAEGQ